jgi:hypothetical protein
MISEYSKSEAIEEMIIFNVGVENKFETRKKCAPVVFVDVLKAIFIRALSLSLFRTTENFAGQKFVLACTHKQILDLPETRLCVSCSPREHVQSFGCHGELCQHNRSGNISRIARVYHRFVTLASTFRQ